MSRVALIVLTAIGALQISTHDDDDDDNDDDDDDNDDEKPASQSSWRRHRHTCRRPRRVSVPRRCTARPDRGTRLRRRTATAPKCTDESNGGYASVGAEPPAQLVPSARLVATPSRPALEFQWGPASDTRTDSLHKSSATSSSFAVFSLFNFDVHLYSPQRFQTIKQCYR